MSGKLRKRIASERADRVTHISSLQTEIAQLEAELRIAVEEDRALKGEPDSEDEDGSSSCSSAAEEALSRRLGSSRASPGAMGSAGARH
jgi:hypothetical protein